MSKTKTKSIMSRADAASHLVGIAEQVRSGSLSESTIAVADQVEVKTEVKEDQIEVELKWHRPASAAPGALPMR